MAKLRKEAISRDLVREDGIETYLQVIPKEHRISAQRCFNMGIFQSQENAEELHKQDPTLTGHGYLWLPNLSEYDYSIPMVMVPFAGWDFSAFKIMLSCQFSTRNVQHLTVSNCTQGTWKSEGRSGQIAIHSD